MRMTEKEWSQFADAHNLDRETGKKTENTAGPPLRGTMEPMTDEELDEYNRQFPRVRLQSDINREIINNKLLNGKQRFDWGFQFIMAARYAIAWAALMFLIHMFRG